AEDSVHLMEYQLVPGGVKARVKQEIPFARKDPHSSIDMTSTSSKTVFVLTDHVNDRTLRCTGG
ncbi:MAG: hypothetical protein KJO07_14690, partial [Deltaproteobacteria bacterium]|nr:hypothetical protein [Deltaproteobacteria bacterium]